MKGGNAINSFKGNSYVSDVIDLSKIKKNEFNLIWSGCGTGKSNFVENHILQVFQDINPNEVLYATSRSLTVNQSTTGSRSEASNGAVVKFDPHDIDLIRSWNGENHSSNNVEPSMCGIHIMTYDKLIYLLSHCNTINCETLCNIKLVILDECHSLFSDEFIRNIGIILLWIKEKLMYNNKIIIGMTATPSIVNYYRKQWGLQINLLNDSPLVKYKADNLYLTNYDSLHLIFTQKQYKDRFTGKTIIMCQTVDHCYELYKRLPNSTFLISKNNKTFKERKHYEKDMNIIRNYVVEHEALPNTVNFDGNKFELEYFITTSTFREGLNLNESSNIKTVVCCIPDEMNITQFMGRCRFNIQNLIVVDENMHPQHGSIEYLDNCHASFKEYLWNRDKTEWLDSIRHLLSDKFTEPVYLLVGNESFDEYIKNNWLNKRILTEEDQNKIFDFAYECKLTEQKRDVNIQQIIKYLKNTNKFEVIRKRMTIKKVKHTYYIFKLKETDPPLADTS